ncbi:MAG TPA: glycosyltransferase family 39 protein [Candidatus Acidoferrum sp.]|nr:glycosyltransferase family 39 protein [Candidatus Acidoferrum sp.]
MTMPATPPPASDSAAAAAPEAWTPEASRPERYIALALFAVSFLYLCIFRHYTSMEPDEGIVLQGAQRILAGQVPYRDFFSFYTPGSYYALAAVFRIFGSSLVVARIALALAGAILSALSYLLARRVCGRGMSLTLAALGTLTTLPYRFLVLHNWDSTLWACLAIYAAVRLLEKPARSWAFAAGIFASLTALSEQSKGAGLCLGLAIGLLAIWFVEGKPAVTRAALLALVSGFAIPFAVTFAYFASQHAVSAMLADWLWPLRHYSLANRVPYGYQNWSDASRHLLFGTGSPFVRLIKILAVSPCFWIPALPPVALGLLVYWIVQARRSAPTAASRYYILVAAAYVGLALSVVLTRADIIHFMYLQPLNCVVLAWLLHSSELDSREVPTRLLRRARPALAAYVVISLSIFGLAPLASTASAPERLMTRRGEVTTPARDTVVEYFQAHVPPGKTVLVYPYLPLYYYLTGTFSPGPYDYFQPGMHTREQADEIVRELASGRVDEVLFEPNFSDKVAHSWPGTPLAAIAQDPVADYIAHHYRPCRDLTSPAGWEFLFMVRKDLACP